jgi:hypothetical protein
MDVGSATDRIAAGAAAGTAAGAIAGRNAEGLEEGLSPSSRLTSTSNESGDGSGSTLASGAATSLPSGASSSGWTGGGATDARPRGGRELPNRRWARRRCRLYVPFSISRQIRNQCVWYVLNLWSTIWKR